MGGGGWSRSGWSGHDYFNDGESSAYFPVDDDSYSTGPTTESAVLGAGYAPFSHRNYGSYYWNGIDLFYSPKGVYSNAWTTERPADDVGEHWQEIVAGGDVGATGSAFDLVGYADRVSGYGVQATVRQANPLEASGRVAAAGDMLHEAISPPALSEIYTSMMDAASSQLGGSAKMTAPPAASGIISSDEGWEAALGIDRRDADEWIIDDAGLGVAQGALNSVNGFQDILTSVVNLGIKAWNWSPQARISGLQFEEFAYYDWSRDLLIRDDPTHDISKFIGGESVATLVTGGAIHVAKVAYASRVGNAAQAVAKVRYGAHLAGPLESKVAATFRGGSYTQAALESDTVLYRVYGGSSRKLGPYWTRNVPQGPLQAKMDLALPPGNTAQSVAKIRVPKNSTIFEGTAGPSFGHLGGGNQVYIPRVDPSWVLP